MSDKVNSSANAPANAPVNAPASTAAGSGFVRSAGLAGIAFAILILLGNALLVPIGLPTPGSGLRDVIAFYGEDHGAFDFVSSLTPLAWVAATVFGAGAVLVLWRQDRARREAWSLVGLAGVLLQNATFAGLIAVRFALGAAAGEGSEGEAGTAAIAGLWALHDGLLGLNGTFLALAMVGLSISGLRAGLIGRWHGLAGFVAATLQLAAALLAPLVIDGAKSFGLVGLAGWLIWVGWLVGYGIALIRLAGGSEPYVRGQATASP